MIISTFPSGPFETNAYIVACQKTQRAAFIDPAPNSAQALIAHIDKHHYIPDKILLTHSHWDHIADTAELKKTYKIPVYIHALDAPNLMEPGSDRLPCWISIEGVTPDHYLDEGDTVAVGDLLFHVIHTPGHTPGGICLYCKEQGVLLSGDTLFRGSIGNLSFPTAQPNLMWQSLDKLAILPPETKVFPGHGSSTTIGKESWLPNAREYFS